MFTMFTKVTHTKIYIQHHCSISWGDIKCEQILSKNKITQLDSYVDLPLIVIFHIMLTALCLSAFLSPSTQWMRFVSDQSFPFKC